MAAARSLRPGSPAAPGAASFDLLRPCRESKGAPECVVSSPRFNLMFLSPQPRRDPGRRRLLRDGFGLDERQRGFRAGREPGFVLRGVRVRSGDPEAGGGPGAGDTHPPTHPGSTRGAPAPLCLVMPRAAHLRACCRTPSLAEGGLPLHSS